MRCDGAKPSCANCINRKQECEYPVFVKHRGPNRHKNQQMEDQAAAQAAHAAAAAAAAAAGIHAHMTPYSVNGIVMYHPGIPAPSAYVPPGGMMPMPYPVSPNGRLKRSAEDYDAEDGEDEEDADGQGDEYSQTDGVSGKKSRSNLRGGKRATMACHSCRQRKMKCDETQPACSQCLRRNIVCQYDDFVRRRGPSKKKRIEGTDVHLITNPSPAAPTHPGAPHMNLVPMPYSFPGAPPDAPKYMALMDPNGMPVQILGIEHPGMHHHPHMVVMHAPHPEEHDGEGEDDGEHEHEHEQGSPQQGSGDENEGENEGEADGEEDDGGLGQPTQHPTVVWS